MLSYTQALEQLLAAAVPVAGVEQQPLAAARGRVLARDCCAAINIPPEDNSSMDGYAVRSADCAVANARLVVSQRIAAGSQGGPLAAGEAARIFTGAPTPPGADAVVMQELCEAADGHVVITRPAAVGDNIRRAGEDIKCGDKVLVAGAVLGAVDIGLAASLGLDSVAVHRRLRVALLSTGDELVEPGQPLPPGCIYNSNRYFLRPLLEGFGCEVIDCGRVVDRFDATRDALREAAVGADLILSTGGVSVGEEDHVKAAIESEGSLQMWKIAIKPGKPLAFGKIAEADFIGLPGNPVSSFVTFLTLVRPFILKRMGARRLGVTPRRLTSASDWPRPDRRREFLRARVNDDGRVELFPNQGSGVLTSCAWADGLIDNPPEQAFAAGDSVSFLSFSDLLRP